MNGGACTPTSSRLAPHTSVGPHDTWVSPAAEK
ncbi:hypothetical protein NPIL_4651, partial [Nephila pilipes]